MAMDPKEMRDLASGISMIDGLDPSVAAAVWRVGAEICERLDRMGMKDKRAEREPDDRDGSRTLPGEAKGQVLASDMFAARRMLASKVFEGLMTDKPFDDYAVAEFFADHRARCSK